MADDFTPGPWQARPTGHGGIIGPRWEVGGPNDGLPVVCDIRDNGHNQTHGGANARLIAAAPDLLRMTELLERFLVYEIKKSEQEGDDEGARLKSFTLAEVSAILTKARGCDRHLTTTHADRGALDTGGGRRRTR